MGRSTSGVSNWVADCLAAFSGLGCLAARGRGNHVELREICGRTGLPKARLLRAFSPLVRAGIVRRAPCNAEVFALARPAKLISVKDIVRELDGSRTRTPIPRLLATIRVHGRRCDSRDGSGGAERAIARLLSRSLADLVRKRPARKPIVSPRNKMPPGPWESRERNGCVHLDIRSRHACTWAGPGCASLSGPRAAMGMERACLNVPPTRTLG